MATYSPYQPRGGPDVRLANVYDSLGEAVEAAGDLERARDLFQKAFDLAQETNDPATAAFLQHLEAVVERLATR